MLLNLGRSLLPWATVAMGFPPAHLSKVLSRRTTAHPFPASAPAALRMYPSSPSSSAFLEDLSASVSKATGTAVDLVAASGGGTGGGGGASVGTVADVVTGTRYFYKAAAVVSGGQRMLNAEYEGVRTMAETETIRVPRPICTGFADGGIRAFVVFEHLEFQSVGDDYRMGRDLAAMHRSTSLDGKFGFHIDNTIGATPQPNVPAVGSWPDFWDEKRLGHMLRLTGRDGITGPGEAEALRAKTKEMLSHGPAPSLLHGDLWGGNTGFCKDGDDTVPVIFDPATYYGDREADVAMTYLFGGFGRDFYRGYEDEWPLPDGHEYRRTVYNLYHILNHQVLFGGGYAQQARGMIHEILQS